MILAVNGPLYVRQIARAIRSDSRKTFDMVEYLRKAGLVDKRDVPGGRKYVRINQKHPCYAELLPLLRAMEGLRPQLRLKVPKTRWYLTGGSVDVAATLEFVFQSYPRSTLLLAVAAAGHICLSDVYDLFGLEQVSAWYVADYWQRQGIIKSEYKARMRILSLDERCPVFPELARFLQALTALDPDIRIKAEIGREKTAARLARWKPRPRKSRPP